MTKRNTAVGLVSESFAGTSGLYQRAESRRASLPQGPVMSLGGDSTNWNAAGIWQRVDKCIQRLALSDPRRRLLELARLRHDVTLAEAVLQNL
jgi:hypothetical protein